MPASNPTTPLRWGFLATGNIARKFARALRQTDSGTGVSVGSRSEANARAFAADFPEVTNVHASYESLLRDPDVDVIYLSTPHPMHVEWAVRTAEAGKHLLCEKPISMDEQETLRIIDAARANNVFLMEAFMYRCTQQTSTAVRLIREGAIGSVRTIDATFCFNIGDTPRPRHQRKDLGGGGILDIGCYPVSFANLIAATALDRATAEPIDVVGAAHLDDNGIDEHASALLTYDNGIIARATCAIRVDEPTRAIVSGTGGHLILHNPWAFARDGAETADIFVYPHEHAEARRVTVSADRPLYAIEADEVARCIAAGAHESPHMTWDDTVAGMRTLDRWRRCVGLRY